MLVVQIAKILERAGVDALDIDAGGYETWYLPHPPSTIKPGFKIDLAAKTKEVVNIPVIASGKLGYPNIAEQVLQKSQADFICLGRPLIADPHWVKKLEENRLEDIRPCIGCHEGCLKRIYEHKYISCAVNPAAGSEKRMIIEKAEKFKKVLVIGGGVAGMEAARVSALRGHRVRLLEKKPDLGGNFRLEFLPDFKSDYKKYIIYLITQLKKHKVEVLTNHEFTDKDYERFQPDVVFIATGARYNFPDIPGIDSIKKLSVVEAFKIQPQRSKILVIGGGLVGTEGAINLAQNGAEVVLVEKTNTIARDAFLPNRMHLLKLIENYQIKVFTETELLHISGNSITCRDKDGSELILQADMVVPCMERSSERSLINFFEGKAIKTIAIGDCVHPRKVINAVWEAYRKARLI